MIAVGHTLLKSIDQIIGSPICAALRLITLRRKQPPADPKKILLIKLWAIGDTITMLPLAQRIKQEYPQAKIDILCRHQNYRIAAASGLFRKTLLFEPEELLNIIGSAQEYDIVFDGEPFLRLSAMIGAWMGRFRIGFSHDIRKMTYHRMSQHRKDRHMVENYLHMLDPLGIQWTKPESLVKLQTAPQDRSLAEAMLAQKGISKADQKDLVLIAPNVGAEGRTRLWQAEKWARLAEHMHHLHGAKVAFIGVKADRAYISKIMSQMQTPSIDLSGEMTLTQTIALIGMARMAISLDAGIMHIAAAQGVPTIGLFGPNVPSLWGAYGKRCINIYNPLSCSPCIENRTGYIPDCLRDSDRYLCMRSITVEEVLTAAGELYESRTRPSDDTKTSARERRDKKSLRTVTIKKHNGSRRTLAKDTSRRR